MDAATGEVVLDADALDADRADDGTLDRQADEPEGATYDARPRRVGPFAIGVICLSSVAHLVELGRRPLAHDEAIDAWFSWQARSWGIVKYDPVYHGPLRFYVEGPVLNLLGTTPGWARLVAAIAGIATTVVVACSVRLLGRLGAPFAALLFTVSPTALTVTRTGREDSLTALVSVGLLLVVAHALTGPRPRHLVAAGALVATSFGLKETTFLFGFAGACFFTGLAVVAALNRRGASRRFFAALRQLGALPWMWTTVAFLAVFLVIFTSGFRYQEGFTSGLVDGVKYWWSQQPVGRGSQRWFFYGTIYLAYELLVLAFAGIGLVLTVRRRSTVGAWFATMAVVQFAVYSWASEKFAWLALHPLLPAFLLAGLGAQAVWHRIRVAAERDAVWQWRARIAVAATALAVVGTALVAVRPAITHGADTSELLVTVQTTTSVPDVHDRLMAARERGELGAILVDESAGGSWPWAWYLHGVDDVAYQTIDPTQPLPEGFDAYLVSATFDPPPPVPAGYDIERFPMRGWWLPDYDDVSLGDLLRWLLTRETWSERGTSDQYLIIRSSANG
jgi:uncharacterized protein (TIGR03663 family)